MDAADEVSFDILEILPEQICENIFGYLSGSDLLTCSLLNSTWYDYIANNQECMKKIKLIFSHKNCNAITILVDDSVMNENMEMLKNSRRKYENIEFLHFQSVFREVQEIMEVPGRQWKEVHLKQINFPSTRDCINFLNSFERTVENLKMDTVYVNWIYYEGDQLNFTFPKLKKLSLNYIQTLIYREAFADCRNLKEFYMATGDQTVTSLEAIQKIFRRNENLEKLSIITNTFTKYFDSEVTKRIKFKLKSFEIRDSFDHGDVHHENFKEFLETQISSLEEITIGDWMGMEVTKMIFHMPRLTTFIFRGFHNIQEEITWGDVEFHKNLTIETFHFVEFLGKIEILKAFLAATPNVKHLTLYSITNESLAYVSKALPHLETLSMEIFEATDISDPSLFPKLTRVSAKVFHNDLEITTSDDKPKLSNFEKLVDAKMKEVNPEGKKSLPKRTCCEHNHAHMMFY